VMGKVQCLAFYEICTQSLLIFRDNPHDFVPQEIRGEIDKVEYLTNYFTLNFALSECHTANKMG
jgi:hypothetical protein